VDTGKMSVSGFSSGGAMATQLHVAYSSAFVGVGIIAGGKHRRLVIHAFTTFEIKIHFNS